MTCCTLLQQLTAKRGAVLFEVLLDLQKAYDALDRDKCLEILTDYMVGLRSLQRLRTHQGCLTMVARDVRYYRLPFKEYRVITHGYPLPPTLFNVVVDIVIRH